MERLERAKLLLPSIRIIHELRSAWPCYCFQCSWGTSNSTELSYIQQRAHSCQHGDLFTQRTKGKPQPSALRTPPILVPFVEEPAQAAYCCLPRLPSQVSTVVAGCHCIRVCRHSPCRHSTVAFFGAFVGFPLYFPSFLLGLLFDACRGSCLGRDPVFSYFPTRQDFGTLIM